MAPTPGQYLVARARYPRKPSTPLEALLCKMRGEFEMRQLVRVETYDEYSQIVTCAVLPQHVGNDGELEREYSVDELERTALYGVLRNSQALEIGSREIQTPTQAIDEIRRMQRIHQNAPPILRDIVTRPLSEVSYEDRELVADYFSTYSDMVAFDHWDRCQIYFWTGDRLLRWDEKKLFIEDHQPTEYPRHGL